MAARFALWCPNCTKKHVHGRTDPHSLKRYTCSICRSAFTIEELEAYGNNMSRARRQERYQHQRPSPVILSGDAAEW